MRMNDRVTVVGGGLAGCEAAWQLLKRGIPVRLVEMKPGDLFPGPYHGRSAELVCSNSLKAEHLTNASGLLKAEMKKLDSLILDCAERAPGAGPAGAGRGSGAFFPGGHPKAYGASADAPGARPVGRGARRTGHYRHRPLDPRDAGPGHLRASGHEYPVFL